MPTPKKPTIVIMSKKEARINALRKKMGKPTLTPTTTATSPTPSKKKKAKKPGLNVEKAIAEKKQRIKDALTQLTEIFPKAFLPKGEEVPLKINVHIDILETLEKGGQFNFAKRTYRMALEKYAKRPTYREKLSLNAQRFDLNGEPAGTVTEAEILKGQKAAEEKEAKKQAKLAAQEALKAAKKEAKSEE